MDDETRGAPITLPLALPGAWATTSVANDVASEGEGEGEPASAPFGVGLDVGEVPGSRAMRSIGYDAVTRTLRVEWSSGNAYALYDVPPELHEGLAAAHSKGRYFQDHLRDRFVHERLR